MHEAIDAQMTSMRKTLTTEINQTKTFMGQKINELIDLINELQQKIGMKNNQKMQATIQMLK